MPTVTNLGPCDCCPGPVVTCCPTPVPRRLYLTFTNWNGAANYCACATDGPIELNYNAGALRWEGSGAFCGVSMPTIYFRIFSVVVDFVTYCVANIGPSHDPTCTNWDGFEFGTLLRDDCDTPFLAEGTLRFLADATGDALADCLGCAHNSAVSWVITE